SMQFALAGEGGQEDVMVGRVLCDQDGAGDAARRVGVLLERRVPEVLGVVLLTDRKTDLRRASVTGKCEREADLYGAAVRPLALAFEMQRLGNRNPGGAEFPGVSRGILALQHHEGETLLTLEEDAVEGTEQQRESGFARNLFGCDHRQQLDEEARKLNEMIVCAPGMAVARPDREAEPAIEIGCGVEVAHRVDDMVETAGHDGEDK